MRLVICAALAIGLMGCASGKDRDPAGYQGRLLTTMTVEPLMTCIAGATGGTISGMEVDAQADGDPVRYVFSQVEDHVEVTILSTLRHPEQMMRATLCLTKGDRTTG